MTFESFMLAYFCLGFALFLLSILGVWAKTNNIGGICMGIILMLIFLSAWPVWLGFGISKGLKASLKDK